MNQLGPRILEFLILFYMLLFVEVMASEQTDVRICLVVTLAVDTFERVEAWFTLFGFKMGKIGLEVCLATPGEMVMVFNLMRAIVL